jgi:aminopeptidase-like protein
MANNELSGPTVTTYLAKWIQSQPRKYTYRIIFIPETIGSICYLSRNLNTMKENIVAGYNISCVGDDDAYSYLPSRAENTISDKIALHVLKHTHPDFVRYSYLDRGSDERQYCSPGVDLPIASVMRTKYGKYKQYHTSLDDLNYISAEGLNGAYEVLQQCLECIEKNEIYRTTTLCEPKMDKRNLRQTLGAGVKLDKNFKNIMDVLVYADGKNDLLTIAEKLNVPMWSLFNNIEMLLREKLIKKM